MVKKLILETANKALEFVVVNELEWCRIYFRNGQIVNELGADTRSIVVKRFLSILSDKAHNLIHMIDDEEQYIRFIMLFEKHTIGYMRLYQNGILLHFCNGVHHNDEDSVIGDIHLSHVDCIRWKEALLSFMRGK